MPKKVTDHLTKRKGSSNWYFLVNVPPAMRAANPGYPRKLFQTTGTDDRLKAQIVSAPWLAEWRTQLSIHHATSLPKSLLPRSDFELAYKVAPGTKTENPDGTITTVYKNRILTMDRDFNIVKDEPNYPLNIEQLVTLPHLDGGSILLRRGMAKNDIDYKRVNAGERDVDMEAIKNWATFGKGVNPRFVKEATDALKLFREIIPGITFATADYDDGVRLADALYAKGNKYATVRKKIAFLRRAVVLAKRSPKRFPALKGRDNPFSAVVAPIDDAQDKVMFDEADMRLIRSRIDELGRNERHLLTWCLATGCRRGEPFEITKELEIEPGYRSIRFGTKTEASDRTIPLPPALLALYPEPIKGPLFTDKEDNIGKRLNAWLDKIGITDPSKSLHSTRHRASYKLRRQKDSLRWECLGHESRRATSETYGAYPQDMMFEALSSIGI